MGAENREPLSASDEKDPSSAREIRIYSLILYATGYYLEDLHLHFPDDAMEEESTEGTTRDAGAADRAGSLC